MNKQDYNKLIEISVIDLSKAKTLEKKSSFSFLGAKDILAELKEKYDDDKDE